MNPLFKQLMGQASRLTLTGDLGAATAAIQDALAQRTAKADPTVIDVVAREVHGPGQAPPTAPAAGRFLRATHAETIGTRDYKLYVPPTYTGQPLPLVVMLHGCTQDPDDFAAGTGMNDAALADGFFVLYPAQSQQGNPQRCWNWFKHNHQQRDRGEPALIANMTREVMKQYNIDPGQVYAAGLSAGGAMAAILGEAYPDLFMAVGVHSGLPVGCARDVNGALMAMKNGAPRTASRKQTTPAPTIVFHGDRDTTVHPVNGEHVVATLAAGTVVEQEHVRSIRGHAYTRRQHRDAHGKVVAEHWVVHGSAHAWSGGRAQGSYTDARGPDATREMLRFFKGHARLGRR
ncbi:PHB depolymerase family esterase [Aquabacterium sp. CECT 9606]|uniref:extracellular catalytic domain type 1 short-chain-length polyhydroxyalkanoate depolymerase n=1 Tax=Aquabacterium sp. CECT 9606 TaxID=2845822 RepID=UPI001E4EBF8E|nr:PHB depolymerase family esterase [Aquabacterium sp. CECT 9606]